LPQSGGTTGETACLDVNTQSASKVRKEGVSLFSNTSSVSITCETLFPMHPEQVYSLTAPIIHIENTIQIMQVVMGFANLKSRN
jgi:hypothetical protein